MRKPVFWIVLIIALAAAVGLYLWRLQAQQQERLEPLPVHTAEAPEPATSIEPETTHALPAARSPADGGAKSVPPLAASDEALHQSLAALVGEQPFRGIFIPQDIVRHIVITVDNLPRDKVDTRALPVKRPAGQTVTSGAGEGAVLDPSNYARYRSYVKLTQAADAKQVVAVYVHFYPLFQQVYRELGYPKRSFNDRLVEVIDDLLEAPDVQGTVKLVRPKVMYEFAAPELEDLSAGQKILIRMGPENAAVVKAKLSEIRRELVAQAL